MAISFEKAFSIHPKALYLRDRRAEVLASNLANSDTPGFKAQDLDFHSVLKSVQAPSVSLRTTQAGHITPGSDMIGARLLYRTPSQPSLDGNTVESHIEQGHYAKNALQHQATMRFINGSVSGMLTAIRGE